MLITHNGKCAISGSDVEQALEAAHIIPYLGSETNHPSNGLLLRADLHTLFDLNLIAIDPEEMTVLIAPSLRGKYCEEFAGKKIYIPENSMYAPSKKALKKRYEQCEWLKKKLLYHLNMSP
ncbi:MAG: HNH endonuclease [Nostoc sp.]|uniref:HNH endonuclease n=1 Tax=Nostoc sp. TaxID=1180 RepID=UPI002FF917BC